MNSEPLSHPHVFPKTEELAAASISPQFIAALEALGGFRSEETFNQFCKGAIAAWQKANSVNASPSRQFSELLSQIKANKPGTIPTPWGGVVVEKYLHPEVEKYLVVRRNGYLAFEKHAEKIETIIVEEGTGLLVYRPQDERGFSLKLLVPGQSAHFEPGYEHCVIGLDNLLIKERSTDPKGMDKDLIFIFSPAASN